MHERRMRPALFVRRKIRRHKVNPVELVPFQRCPRQGHVPAMYRIERPAKEGDVHGWLETLRISGAQACLDEMTWRLDNRKNPHLFRDTMLKLIHSDNLECKELTKAVWALFQFCLWQNCRL